MVYGIPAGRILIASTDVYKEKQRQTIQGTEQTTRDTVEVIMIDIYINK